MKKFSVYECEICGKQFIENPSACRQHEQACNKCNSCAHAYYVYGCEFACEYNNAGKCGPDLKFCKYEEVKNG